MPLRPDTFLPTTAPGHNLEIHLDLGTIQGESASRQHPQEIVINSFSWGATNSAVRSAQGSPKGGKPSVSEITVTKSFDKATPQLFNAVVSTTVIKTAKISISKSTGGNAPEDHMTITMTGVYISSHQMTSSRDQPGSGIGSETITLNFQTVAIDYKMQLGSGLLTSAGSASYDLMKGL